MKIAVNIDKVQDTNQSSFFSNKSEIIKTMEKMPNFSCLISGYRGVGKTTLVKTIEEHFKNSKELNIFIYQNLDKYENYSLLLRKLIRELFLQMANDDRFQDFNERHVDLFNKIGNLHENSFFRIDDRSTINALQENKKMISSSFSVGKFFENILPVVSMLIATINWKTSFLTSKIGFSGVLGTFLWFMINNIKVEHEFFSKSQKRKEVEKTLLYDDEIAEYHLCNLLRELQNKGIRIFFVFDEIDKIDDSKKLKQMMADLKHLLLMENSSSIVISGQKLFYEYILSGIKDDGLISNIFSLNIHVPLMNESVLLEMLDSYFFEGEGEIDKSSLEYYINSLILNTRKVARNINSFVMNEIEWENEVAYIKIDEARMKSNENDSKILEIIRDIESNIILKLEVESAQVDLLDYHLFLWIKKIKLSENNSFTKNEIFNPEDEYIKKYPYWYKNRLNLIFNILIERLEESKLIEQFYNDSNIQSFRLTFTNGDRNTKKYQKVTINFFENFVLFEQIIRKIGRDLTDEHKKNISLKSITGNLSRIGVIDSNILNKITIANEMRNKIAHGEELTSNEIDIIHSISMDDLIREVYEQYTHFFIREILTLENAEVTTKSIIGNNSIGKMEIDIILKRQNDSNILFDVKVTNQPKITSNISSRWLNFLKKYNAETKKENILIIFVYLKNSSDTFMRFEPPHIDKSSSLMNGHIFVVYIPEINSIELVKLTTRIINGGTQ